MAQLTEITAELLTRKYVYGYVEIPTNSQTKIAMLTDVVTSVFFALVPLAATALGCACWLVVVTVREERPTRAVARMDALEIDREPSRRGPGRLGVGVGHGGSGGGDGQFTRAAGVPAGVAAG